MAPPFPVIPFTQTNTHWHLPVVASMSMGSNAMEPSPSTSSTRCNRIGPRQHSCPSPIAALHSGNNSYSANYAKSGPGSPPFFLLVLCLEWWLFSRSYRPQPTTGTTGQKGLLRNNKKQNRILDLLPTIIRLPLAKFIRRKRRKPARNSRCGRGSSPLQVWGVPKFFIMPQKNRESFQPNQQINERKEQC